jgi:hypothetical protein
VRYGIAPRRLHEHPGVFEQSPREAGNAQDEQADEKRQGRHGKARSDVAIQIKIPRLSVEATKKSKKVWIASLRSQ